MLGASSATNQTTTPLDITLKVVAAGAALACALSVISLIGHMTACPSIAFFSLPTTYYVGMSTFMAGAIALTVSQLLPKMSPPPKSEEPPQPSVAPLPDRASVSSIAPPSHHCNTTVMRKPFPAAVKTDLGALFASPLDTATPGPSSSAADSKLGATPVSRVCSRSPSRRGPKPTKPPASIFAMITDPNSTDWDKVASLLSPVAAKTLATNLREGFRNQITKCVITKNKKGELRGVCLLKFIRHSSSDNKTPIYRLEPTQIAAGDTTVPIRTILSKVIQAMAKEGKRAFLEIRLTSEVLAITGAELEKLGFTSSEDSPTTTVWRYEVNPQGT